MNCRYLTCGCCSYSQRCARIRGILPSTITMVSCSSNRQSRFATNHSSECSSTNSFFLSGNFGGESHNGRTLSGQWRMRSHLRDVEGEETVLMELLYFLMVFLHQVIFNLTVNCKSEDESDLSKVASTVNRLLRITIKVCESVTVWKCESVAVWKCETGENS